MYLVLNGYGFFTGKIAKYFLPINNTILEFSKVFITSSLLMILFEYFIISNVPNNYLFSRMISIILMLISYFIIIKYYQFNFIILFLIIILSTFLTFFIQKRSKLKGEGILGFLILLFLFFYLNNI